MVWCGTCVCVCVCVCVHMCVCTGYIIMYFWPSVLGSLVFMCNSGLLLPILGCNAFLIVEVSRTEEEDLSVMCRVCAHMQLQVQTSGDTRTGEEERDWVEERVGRRCMHPMSVCTV
jgi:hypothetical protein